MSLPSEKDLDYYEKIAPAGFGFFPTTNELFEYLRWKKNGNPQANIIKEVLDLNKYNPYDLQRIHYKGKGDELYLFTKSNRLTPNGLKTVRRAGNGKWKNIGLEKIKEGNRLIGYRTVLSFVDKKKKKTGWNMHEYSLPLDNGKRKMKDEYVLCRIYRCRSKSNRYETSNDGSILVSSGVDIGEAESADIISCSSSQRPSFGSVTSDPKLNMLDLSPEAYTENYLLPQPSSKVSSLAWHPENVKFYRALEEYFDLPLENPF